MDSKREREIRDEEILRERTRRYLRDQEHHTQWQGNKSEAGCLKLFAFALAVAITWILILYIGIPIAILGSFVSYYLYKNHKNGDDVFENEKEFPIAAVIVAVASILIGIGSILGNIYDDDAPYNKFFRGASKNIEVSKSNTPVDDN